MAIYFVFKINYFDYRLCFFLFLANETELTKLKNSQSFVYLGIYVNILIGWLILTCFLEYDICIYG